MYAGMRKMAVRAAILSMILSAGPIAQAAISRVVFEVSATSSAGSAVQSFDLDATSFAATTNELAWELGDVIAFRDGTTGAVVGELRSATVLLDGEPNIEIDCEFVGGDLDTTFRVSSMKIFFEDTESGAGSLSCRARAAFTVIDQDGNGAFLRGDGPPGTGAFQARFNDGATTFASLVANIQTSAGGTAAGFQNYPPFGYQPLTNSINEMSSEIAFVLSANDRATATTIFDLRGAEFQLFTDGDLNCDAQLGANDITGFVLALTDSASYDHAFPECARTLADVDQDDVVSLTDIAAFIDRILNG